MFLNSQHKTKGKAGCLNMDAHSVKIEPAWLILHITVAGHSSYNEFLNLKYTAALHINELCIHGFN